MINAENKYSLKQLRGIKGSTQEETSKYIGITREHYSRIECDSNMLRNSKIEVILKIAEYFNVSLDQIDFFAN